MTGVVVSSSGEGCRLLAITVHAHEFVIIIRYPFARMIPSQATISAQQLPLQFRNFLIVGLAAACVHYGLLILLVEGIGLGKTVSTLIGYVSGGVFSYCFNRSYTYASERSHREAGWRFAVVAAIGFALTGALMHVLNGILHWPYLLAQVAITGIVLVWHFLAHRIWTFAAA